MEQRRRSGDPYDPRNIIALYCSQTPEIIIYSIFDSEVVLSLFIWYKQIRELNCLLLIKGCAF